MTGSDSAGELEAFISRALCGEVLRELDRSKILALVVTVTAFVAAVLGAVVTFLTSGAPLGLLIALVAFVCLGAATRAGISVKKALTVNCG